MLTACKHDGHISCFQKQPVTATSKCGRGIAHNIFPMHPLHVSENINQHLTAGLEYALLCIKCWTPKAATEQHALLWNLRGKGLPSLCIIQMHFAGNLAITLLKHCHCHPFHQPARWQTVTVGSPCVMERMQPWVLPVAAAMECPCCLFVEA